MMTMMMLMMIFCWKVEKQQVSRCNCVCLFVCLCMCVWLCVCGWVREREVSVLFNDADNYEGYVALMLDEWNMSGDLVEGYMTGENRSKGKGKVHPIIGHEGPEVENRSGQRTNLSQYHKSKKGLELGTNPRMTRVNRNRNT